VNDLVWLGSGIAFVAAITAIEAIVRKGGSVGIAPFVRFRIALKIALPIYCLLILLGLILLMIGLSQ
jgi:hypothetical protein